MVVKVGQGEYSKTRYGRTSGSKDGGNVDAITAATIHHEPPRCINRAAKALTEYRKITRKINERIKI